MKLAIVIAAESLNATRRLYSFFEFLWSDLFVHLRIIITISKDLVTQDYLILSYKTCIDYFFYAVIGMWTSYVLHSKKVWGFNKYTWYEGQTAPDLQI